MRKVFLFFISVFIFMCAGAVSAAGNITVSSTSVLKGNSITVRVVVSNAAAWNLKLTSSGPVKLTSGSTDNLVGDSGNGENTSKTFTFVYKTTSTGTATFKITGDTTNEDLSTTNVSVTKTVTIKEASTNNYLKSLSVEGANLIPSFDKTDTSYSVIMKPGTTSIKINATKEDSTSSVSGNGTIKVSEGNNTVVVKVTSQSGDIRKYVINVAVEEYDPVKVTIGTSEYTVIRKKEQLSKPDDYEETIVEIDENEIPAFKNDITKFTLVGLKDVTGETELYIYNEKEKTYTLYKETNSSNLRLYITKAEVLKEELTKSEIVIDGVNYEAYINKNIDYPIVYAMNIKTGEYNYYTYDSEENTFQRYKEVLIDGEKTVSDGKNYKVILGILSGTIILLVVIIIVLINRKNSN